MSKLIRPFTVSDAALVSSTATETVALWNSGTTYAAGDTARSDTTHRIYRSVIGSNLNNNPTTDDGTKWLDIGPTNIWAMFDNLNGTQTTYAGNLVVEIDATGRFDTVGLLNISGTAVTIVAEDGAAVEHYNETYSLIDDTPIVDWWSYFFEEITYKTDLVVTDIPVVQDLTFTITITGNPTACGVLVIGLSRDIGAAQYGSSVGIKDYSVKSEDDFGNYTITERAFSKRGNFQMFVESNRVDGLYNLFAQYRTTPLLWVMTDDYTRSFIFGFYKAFEFVFAHPSHDEYDLVIEGLT